MDQYATTDHDRIRDWVEKHHGTPAAIKDPTSDQKIIGLRIDFPGNQDETDLSRTRISSIISWEEFFTEFDNQQLLFVVDDTSSRDPSLNYRLLPRQTDTETSTINPDQVREAIIGPRSDDFNLPDPDNQPPPPLESAVGNDTLTDNPPESVIGEQEASGDMPDPASDDNPTENARRMGLILPNDPRKND